MKRFKNRTVAICIASLITVLGAFGAENYSNTLMSLNINSSSDGVVSLTAYTQKPFKGQLQTEVEGGGVYSIILPETNSNIDSEPNIRGYANITDIEISTMPYSGEMKGYTKIRIKTYGNPTIKPKTMLYLPNNNSSNKKSAKQSATSTSYWDQHQQYSVNTENNNSQKKELNQKVKKVSTTAKNKVVTSPSPSEQVKNTNKTSDVSSNYNKYSNNEKLWIYILFAIVIVGVISLFVMGKDKMASIVGGQDDFDFDDEDKKSIRKKIKKLDKAISKKAVLYTPKTANNAIKTEDVKTLEKENEPNIKNEEDTEEIIDLDSLFDQYTNENNIEESNDDIDDLASFLDNFSNDDEPVKEEDYKTVFDEEFYEDVIKNRNIAFSKSDLKKLAELIQNEVSEDTLNNLSKYVPHTRKKVVIDKTKLMEEILSEYAVKQNIIFTTEDVDVLKSLMSVELDSDFITDLRTNSKLNKKASTEDNKNVSNPLREQKTNVLKVHDLLPNLSEELKKIGNKPIESNAKPPIVYYMDGYDVEKLEVNSELPDITKAINEKDAWKYKPSEVVPKAIDGYKTQTIAVADKLPDLADVKAHPEKYKEKIKEIIVPDEEALLNSLNNVKFKPFYEEKDDKIQSYENKNKLEQPIQTTSVKIDKNINVSVNKQKEEEVKNEKNIEKPQKVEKSIQEKQNISPVNLKKNEQKIKKTSETLTYDEILKKNMMVNIDKEKDIEIQKLTNNKKNIESHLELKNSVENDSNTAKVPENVVTKKHEQGIQHPSDIIKSVECKGITCLLMKNDKGYNIIGKTECGVKYLKHYDVLKTENLQARINEVKKDGTTQYLIRVSIHKFIVDVLNGNMEFVMDLC